MSVKPRLFLSYARTDDEPFVKRLYEDLAAAGFQVWWDRVAMPSRALTFLDEIKRAIANCDRLVLVFGLNTITSDYVRQEWQYALSLCKTVNPVLRLGSFGQLPDALKRLDVRDFRDDADYEAQLRVFLDQLSADLAPLGKPIGVPEIPHQFVERPEIFDALKQIVLAPVRDVLAERTPWLGLRGMGGVGKSVLAAVLGQDCEVRRAFPDGVFWITLGQDPALTVRQAQFGIALGDAPQHYATDIESCKMRLSALLMDKACLLILDNVWKVEHVRAFEVLGPRCQALFTTRNAEVPLALGAMEMTVNVLKQEEALALLRQWAKRDDVALYAIARRLGYLPLGLKLAGARLREGLSGSDWLKSFRHVSQMRLGRRSTDPQENVQASIELSVQQLPDDQDRSLYYALGIFPADTRIPQHVITRLWRQMIPELSQFDCDELIVELARLALIERTTTTPSMVSMHDLLHDYTWEKLGDRVTQAHSTLLTAYNGEEKPWSYISNDGYLYDHLEHHLRNAGRWDMLAGLFDDHTWMHNRFEQRDFTYVGFIQDVMTAWQEGPHKETLRAIEHDADVFPFAACFRYALIRTSINSLSANYLPELVQWAVETGLWAPHRALSVAARAPTASPRVAMYVALLRTGKLSEQEHGDILEQALTSAQQPDPHLRAELLTDVLPYVQDEQRDHIIEHALVAALTIGSAEYSVTALANLLPYLRGRTRSIAIAQGLESIADMQEELDRGRGLHPLAPYLEGNELYRALQIALAIQEPWPRAQALIALVPRLQGQLLEAMLTEAFNTTLHIDHPLVRSWMLAKLAPSLQGQQHAIALDSGLAAAMAVQEPDMRADRLAMFIPYVSGKQQQELLALAVTAARTAEYAGPKVDALLALLPYVQGEQQQELLALALTAAKAIEDGKRGAKAFAALLPYVPGEHQRDILAQALTTFLHISDEPARLWALLSLAPHLQGERQSDTLRRVLDIIPTLANQVEWVNALAASAPLLNKELLAQALQITQNMVMGVRAQAVAALLPSLEGQQRADAVTAALEEAQAYVHLAGGVFCAQILVALAPHLQGDALAIALKTALLVEREVDRVEALTGLASRLQGKQRTDILTRALEDALRIGDVEERSRRLSALLPHLESPQRELAQRRALDAAQAIENDWPRAAGLAELASHLHDSMKAEALARGLQAARAVPFEQVRARLLLALIKPLTDEEQHVQALASILDTVLASESKEPGAPVKAERIAESDGVITGWVASVLSISDEALRAWIWAKLVMVMPATRRTPYLIREIRRLVTGYLLKCQSARREDVLRLCGEEPVFNPSVLSSDVLASIADHIIDICWHWEWL